jgi:hypothetical protein
MGQTREKKGGKRKRAFDGRADKAVRRGVSKGVEDAHRLPALWVGHPQNGYKAVPSVARSHGVEGSGLAGLFETIGSPWIPLAIRA